jgi:hypothetical protein
MNWFVEHWHIVTGVVIGVYETVVRIIPTVGSYSIIAKIINLLSLISSSFDRKK